MDGAVKGSSTRTSASGDTSANTYDKEKAVIQVLIHMIRKLGVRALVIMQMRV